MASKLSAEFLGAFWLILGGCGSAMLAATFPNVGLGFVGVSLAFGLMVFTSNYALAPVSSAHSDLAVSFGVWSGKRFPTASLLSHIVAHLAGAGAAAAVLYVVAWRSEGFVVAAGGYGEHLHYSLFAMFVSEFALTFMFLIVILGATHMRAAAGFAGIAIGLALTLIHYISLSGDSSMNPSESTESALSNNEWALQLWVFWIAPILGALVAGFLNRSLSKHQVDLIIQLVSEWRMVCFSVNISFKVELLHETRHVLA